MKDLPRIILKDLVLRYGDSIARDPFRCEALLRDTCGSCGREIFVLTSAVRQHVPLDLLAPRQNFPLSLMKGFMIKRLQDEMGFSDESARWAVDTWADALGLSDEAITDLPAANPPVTLTSQEPAGIRPDTDPAQRQQWTQELESGNTGSRIRAIDQLTRAGDPECIRLLISALENDQWRVRYAAYDALVSLSLNAVPFLIEALGDLHDRLVSRVVLVLAAIRDRTATEPLTALLGRDHSLDLTIIFALGEIGDLRATSPLAKCLVSPDRDISLAASAALQKISRA
ncbi:MAG: HEAT repeat domain-containing protein [Methanoregula sp.]